MIKICHITSSPQNAIPRLIRESKTSCNMGYETYIVSQGKTFIKDGINYIGVKNSKSRIKRMLITSYMLYKSSKRLNADIYQIHDPELLFYGLLLKFKKKIVIFDSHEFYSVQINKKEYLPKLTRKLISKLYLAYEKKICNKLDAVIGVCTINGENHFINHSKTVALIENFPETDFLYKEPYEKSKDPTVVYVGSLTNARGITHLIKATHNTKAKVRLAGVFGSSEYSESLRKMPEYQSVEYRGVLPKEKIIQLIKESWIGVSTLLHLGQYNQIDTLPTKVYEYMALGLPIIISNTEYAKKMNLKHNFGVCVDPSNIEEIEKAINYLLSNSVESEKMGNNGMLAAMNEFNWSIEEKKLMKLYNSLLNKIDM